MPPFNSGGKKQLSFPCVPINIIPEGLAGAHDMCQLSQDDELQKIIVYGSWECVSVLLS